MTGPEATTGLPPTLRRDLFGSDEDWIGAQARLDLDHGHPAGGAARGAGHEAVPDGPAGRPDSEGAEFGRFGRGRQSLEAPALAIFDEAGGAGAALQAESLSRALRAAIAADPAFGARRMKRGGESGAGLSLAAILDALDQEDAAAAALKTLLPMTPAAGIADLPARGILTPDQARRASALFGEIHDDLSGSMAPAAAVALASQRAAAAFGFQAAERRRRTVLQIDRQGWLDQWARDAVDMIGESAAPSGRALDGGGDAPRFRLTAALQGLAGPAPAIASLTLGRLLQTDPIGHQDQSSLQASFGSDPVNRTDSAGPAADDGVERAGRTLRTLKAGIRSEIEAANQPEAGSRTRSGPGIARAAVLRNQLRALNARTPESLARLRVAPPSAAVGAGITDAMRGALPETIYTARGSNGSVTYVQAAQTSRTSDSGHATTETENLLATGHPHDSTAGNEYPGIGDPGNTLRLGVPTIYSYGGNSNAIGWNGSRFTLTNIRGTLPSYQSAPDWIREIFEPW